MKKMYYRVIIICIICWLMGSNIISCGEGADSILYTEYYGGFLFTTGYTDFQTDDALLCMYDWNTEKTMVVCADPVCNHEKKGLGSYEEQTCLARKLYERGTICGKKHRYFIQRKEWNSVQLIQSSFLGANQKVLCTLENVQNVTIWGGDQYLVIMDERKNEMGDGYLGELLAEPVFNIYIYDLNKKKVNKVLELTGIDGNIENLSIMNNKLYVAFSRYDEKIDFDSAKTDIDYIHNHFFLDVISADINSCEIKTVVSRNMPCSIALIDDRLYFTETDENYHFGEEGVWVIDLSSGKEFKFLEKSLKCIPTEHHIITVERMTTKDQIQYCEYDHDGNSIRNIIYCDEKYFVSHISPQKTWALIYDKSGHGKSCILNTDDFWNGNIEKNTIID